MRLLALAVGLLAAHADAKTRHCAETIVNEALIAFDDPACVTDMKSCIKAGTCLAAGIEERRLCECYLQVGRRAGSYASCAALCTQHAPVFMPQNMLFQVQLPLAGRELADYDCKPTEATNTILSDWRRCKRARAKSEL